MPTVCPAPSTLCAQRAEATFITVSASELVDPHAALAVAPPDGWSGAANDPPDATRGASTSPTYRTAGSDATPERALDATSAVTVSYSRLTLTMWAPDTRRRATVAAPTSRARIWTSTRPPARRTRLPTPALGTLSAAARGPELWLADAASTASRGDNFAPFASGVATTAATRWRPRPPVRRARRSGQTRRR